MAIEKGYEANFKTMVRAFKNGDIALLECLDLKTRKKCVVVVATERREGEVNMVPLARMFDGNPYEEIAPPSYTDRGYIAPDGKIIYEDKSEDKPTAKYHTYAEAKKLVNYLKARAKNSSDAVESWTPIGNLRCWCTYYYQKNKRGGRYEYTFNLSGKEIREADFIRQLEHTEVK